MKKDDCIFCKIANGEIPSNTLYEDDSFRVIPDLGPATKGHALVMPKEHFGNLYELPDDWCQKAFSPAKKMAGQMTEKLHCDGFNLVQNNGATAGQTVPHFHIHLIPRYENDGQTINWKQTSPTAEELAAVKKKFLDKTDARSSSQISGKSAVHLMYPESETAVPKRKGCFLPNRSFAQRFLFMFSPLSRLKFQE